MNVPLPAILAIVAVLGMIAGVLLNILARTILARFAKSGPEWVGVTRYEGADGAAAAKAYAELQGETDRIVGRVEWLHGAREIRAFKVV